MKPGPPLWRTFLLFFGPMMVSNILQALSGTINNIYLGQMIGVKALAAVSSFFPVLLFLISFVIGVGSGAAVLIGQAYGARQLDKVRAVVGTTTTVTLIAGAVVALFGGLFARGLVQALGTPPDILADAAGYARVMMFAMPGIFVFIQATTMMRGVGDAVTPLYTLMVSAAIGLVLTPALIRGWGGLPQMGASSGAYASIVSMLVTMVFLGVYLRWRAHPLAPDAEFFRYMRIDTAILRTVVRIGVPTGLNMVMMSLAEVAVLSLVNGFGSEATAAYGAVIQVMSYVQFPAMSIAVAASILGAQAIGAGNADRLGAITRTGLMLNVLITGTLVGTALLFSRSILSLFLTSESVIALAQRLLHITLWSSIFLGCAGVLSGVMRSSGTVLGPTAISMTAIGAVEIPVAYALSARIGLDGVWAAYPIALGSMMLMQGTFYWLVWRKKAVRRLI